MSITDSLPELRGNSLHQLHTGLRHVKIKGNIAHGYRKLLAAVDESPRQYEDRWIDIFRHGTLTVKLYAPRGTDPQELHD